MIVESTEHHSWRKINFRRTSTVLGAEFLHGLYNRHDPFLNPFRFANTVVAFRPWECTSYAPDQEWDRLAARFGRRLLSFPERMVGELDRVLAHPRTRSRKLADELDVIDWEHTDDETLFDLLISMHHIPLGEIYEVNLVQVEHALHAAAIACVAQEMPDEGDPHAVLARLVTSTEPTAGGRLEVDFLDLVLELKSASPSWDASERLTEMAHQHATLGSAYGADTISRELFEHRVTQFMQLDLAELTRRRTILTDRLEPSGGPRLLDQGRLALLVGALTKTGEVRDRNKELLGRVTRHRAAILREIAHRRDAEYESLRLYCLEELLRLCHERARVPDAVLERRMRAGVSFRRSEAMESLEHHPVRSSPSQEGDDTLHGICASPGVHTGRVRRIDRAADLSEMRIGDVVVAAGTDFDLMAILQMAGAIVTEEGGLLSHAAVVARELGIPCLIGVTAARGRLAENELVTVDASAGTVGKKSAGADIPAAHGPRQQEPDPRSKTDALLVALSPDLDPLVAGRKASGLARLMGLGLPIPGPVVVIPARVVNQISSSDAAMDLVCDEILTTMDGESLVLRSSSLIEDGADGTAAGIYHSEVDIPPVRSAIRSALTRVIASKSSARARMYHAAQERDSDAPFGVVVAPYVRFMTQGTAFSHSPLDPRCVAVEFFESPGTGSCPDSGGTILHFAHVDLMHEPSEMPIQHLPAQMRGVAAMALHLSERWGHQVEIEWGSDGSEITLLQARTVTGPLQKALA